MPERPWERFITDLDREVYDKAGFGGHSGVGQRPALLIIDVQYRTVGEKREPILKAMNRYPTAVGARAWEAVDWIQELLTVSRRKGIPVLYPILDRRERTDTGRWSDKISGIGSEQDPAGHRGTQIVEEIAPEPGDIVVTKLYPSGFFGTPLMTYLNNLSVDTLVVTGCTTSGCVRATVVDAFSYGFRVMVPEEAVYDRGEASHAINLFDMSQKYADVLTTDEIVKLLGSSNGW
jgi:maleamate amidohydrolase